MQTYDTYLPPRRTSDHAPAYGPTAPEFGAPAQQIPAARSAYEGEPSGTPIFDALYSEFRRRFRALPGDREGEEDLRFTGFGHYGGGGAAAGHGTWDRPAAAPSGQGSYGGYGVPGRHRGYLSLPPGRG